MVYNIQNAGETWRDHQALHTSISLLSKASKIIT